MIIRNFPKQTNNLLPFELNSNKFSSYYGYPNYGYFIRICPIFIRSFSFKLIFITRSKQNHFEKSLYLTFGTASLGQIVLGSNKSLFISTL